MLVWKRVKFNPNNRKHVPNIRGVYAFIVSGAHVSLPPHGFVMYIGQSGEGKPGRTLRLRYADYLAEQKVQKRPGVHFMLTAWKACIDFCYAEVPDPLVNIKDLEMALNDAMFPPYSTQDFTAEIRDVKKAF
jgi:hypothetical protein